jgi:hypothetical protein
MAYPPKPDIQTSYTAVEQALGDGSLPGQELDVDFANLKFSVDALNDFVRGITRSDGRLGNNTVTRDTLAADILLGLAPPAPWQAGREYEAPATVFEGNRFYIANTPHTSTVFADDLAAGRWVELADLTEPLTEFFERYIGTAASDPLTTPTGGPLVVGMLYYNTVEERLKAWNGSDWLPATGVTSLLRFRFVATSGQTVFTGNDADSNLLEFVDAPIQVHLNGVLLDEGADFTTSGGDTVTLASGAAASDVLTVTAFRQLDFSQLPAQVAADATAASLSAAQAALFDGPWLDSQADIETDTTLTYAGGTPGTVAAGDYVRTRAEGFAYEVLASGAASPDRTTAGGVRLKVLPGADGFVSVLSFGAAGDGVADDAAPVQTAIRSGLPLDWNGRSYRIASSVSATLAGPVLWRGSSAIVTYDPPAHSEFAIALEDTTGFPMVIDDLTLDGQKMCNRGLRVQNNTSNATPSEFTANRLHIRNIKRLNTFTGGEGALLRGAFTSVTFNGGSVVDCELPAGQGTPGVVGIRGIGANAFSVGSYIKRFILRGTLIEKVYSSDPNYTFDQDGVAYFSPDDPDGGKAESLFVCDGGTKFRNCYGRSIKTQCRHTNVLDSIFERTEGLAGGIGNGEVNAQNGSCVVSGNAFSYRNAQTPSNVVSPSSTTGWKSGASIRDNEVYLEDGTVLPSFMEPFPSGVASPWTRMEVVGNRVLGSVDRFVDFLTNSNKAHLTVSDNWVAEIAPTSLSGALGERNLIYVRASGATPPEGNYAYVYAANNVYDGNEEAHILRARVSGTVMDAKFSGYGNFGFVDNWNARVNDPVPLAGQAVAARLTGLENIRFKGYFGMQTKTIEPDTVEVFSCRAFNASFIVLQVSASENSYALFSVAGSISTLGAGSGVTMGGASNPGGSNTFNVWRSGVGEISVQNTTASSRQASVWVFAPN